MSLLRLRTPNRCTSLHPPPVPYRRYALAPAACASLPHRGRYGGSAQGRFSARARLSQPSALRPPLAAAQLKIEHFEHLSATLEERDRTIAQLRRENCELAALQARTLREQEAALDSTVRGLAAGSQPASSTASGLT